MGAAISSEASTRKKVPISGAQPGSIRKVADLDDRQSALLADDRSHFVYLSDWVDVFRVSLSRDSLQVSHEIWGGTYPSRKKAGESSVLLTQKGWERSNLVAPEHYKHHEFQVLHSSTRQLLKAWEILSGKKQALPAASTPAVASRVVDLAKHPQTVRRIDWSADGTRGSVRQR